MALSARVAPFPCRRRHLRAVSRQRGRSLAQGCRGRAPALRFSPGLAVPGARAEAAKDSAAAADFALQASLETRLAYVVTGNGETDRISKAGLSGLSKVLNARTAVEPGEPMGIDPARDELVFFPLIYWPVLPDAEPLPDRVLAKVDAYMKQGGLIIFDTKNDGTFSGSLTGGRRRRPWASSWASSISRPCSACRRAMC